VAPLHAQSDYPNKTIRLIVPFPAGGSTDIVGRVVAQKIQERLGQTVVVENRAGAGGTIGVAQMDIVDVPYKGNAQTDVPTVAEQGYPGFEVELWLGVFAPAGTPAPIVARLHREIVAIAAAADFKAAMERNGAEAASNSPAQFAKLVSTESQRYSKVFQTLGVKLD
jgi:tripartite-type tricarboxylate transporter receptor subunit TctC